MDKQAINGIYRFLFNKAHKITMEHTFMNSTGSLVQNFYEKLNSYGESSKVQERPVNTERYWLLSNTLLH